MGRKFLAASLWLAHPRGIVVAKRGQKWPLGQEQPKERPSNIPAASFSEIPLWQACILCFFNCLAAEPGALGGSKSQRGGPTESAVLFFA